MNAETESDDLVTLSNVSGFDLQHYKTFREQRSAEPTVYTPPSPLPVAEAVENPTSELVTRKTRADLPAPRDLGEDGRATTAISEIDRSSASQAWPGLDAVLNAARRSSSVEPEGDSNGKSSLIYVAGVCSGTGTTSIVSSLIRSVGKHNSQVLVIDAGPANLLSLSLGLPYLSRKEESYSVETQSTLGVVRVTAIDREALDARSLREKLDEVFAHLGSRHDLIIVDAGTTLFRDSDATTSYTCTQILTMLPDTRCLAAWHRVEQETLSSFSSTGSNTLLLLNQFNDSNPLHQEIKTRLRVGSPYGVIAEPIRYDAQVGMALAHNTSIVDYAPESGATQDILSLSRNLFAEHSVFSVDQFRQTGLHDDKPSICAR